MKLEWRAKPHAAHCSMTSAGDVGVPVHAHAGQGRAGPHDGGPHAGALELHLQGADVALEPPLGGHVGGHGRPGSFGTTSEVTNTTSPRRRADHGRDAGRATSRWVPLRLTPSDAVERRRASVSSTAPAMFWPALDTTISTAPSASTAAAWRTARPTRRRPGRGGWRRASPPVGPDGGRGVLALVHPPGPEHDRVARARPAPWRWPGRCPTTRRSRRRGGVGVGLGTRGISAASPWSGRAARPRTLMEWTRSMPSASMS